jgi:predicted MFS family arabinose efflux permease
MAGSLGTAIAPALAVFVARLWSWQGAYVVLGIVAALAAVAVFVSRAQEGMPVERAAAGKASMPAERSRLLLGPLIAIFVVNMLAGFIYRGALTYLPLHLKDNLGLHVLGIEPEDLAGYVATVALVLGIGGQYIGGWLGERVRREALLAPIALCILPFLVLIGVANGVGLAAAAGAFAFFNFMGQPAYTALIADYSPSRAQGSAFGVAFLSAFGIGSFAGTFGGVVAERWSTQWVFISLAGFESLIAVLAAWLYVAARRRARAEALDKRA